MCKELHNWPVPSGARRGRIRVRPVPPNCADAVSNVCKTLLLVQVMVGTRLLPATTDSLCFQTGINVDNVQGVDTIDRFCLEPDAVGFAFSRFRDSLKRLPKCLLEVCPLLMTLIISVRGKLKNWESSRRQSSKSYVESVLMMSSTWEVQIRLWHVAQKNSSAFWAIFLRLDYYLTY
jgi:hypothetical protein